ncbi:hypothetical protein LWI29_017549 [Acer saccharum]|uniref:AAA+ ATPase domain-containing protein n=1 Tax=Acer saccharum TaxID=4024 RepID=A0AA39S7W9_ACESA|nr:hypothetical protein LWI29_017549 [Acer saccharum]
MGFMGMGELGSVLASLMFVWAIFKDHFPHRLRLLIEKYIEKLVKFVCPYIEITFHEFYGGEYMKRSKAFSDIQNYLGKKATSQASKFKADVIKGSKSLILTMDDHEEVPDEFNGVKRTHHWIVYRSCDKEGKNVASTNRQRKLYSNNPSKDWYSGWKNSKWSHVFFEHPATFETLAMETKKKDIIKEDLKKFTQGKDYYKKIGKAWKRGYLLYGPPGTGKSTMIAAMANFLNYDVYDLELTTVLKNTELRNLLIETSSKSIVVIEDIDCSLDLTGQRVKNKNKVEVNNKQETAQIKGKEESDNKSSKVTLSGLLNFIDGLWSACGGERIIVFTTNHVDKLDPALIRRGRMDKHIEMSYCCFEAFKLLANNYLNIDSHELYAKIDMNCMRKLRVCWLKST